MEEKKRGGQEKDVYKGCNVAVRLLKIPEYIVFKRRADALGLSVTELVFGILKNDLEKYKNESEG